MIRKYSYIVLVILTASLGCYFYDDYARRPSEKSVIKESTEQSVESIEDISEVSSSAEKQRDRESALVEKYGEPPEGLSDREWSYFLTVHEREIKKDVSLGFYGRVVDQNGWGVEGAKIVIEISAYDQSLISRMITQSMNMMPFHMKHEEVELHTDASGRFKIANEIGNAIRVKSIEKDGYLNSGDIGINFLYGMGFSENQRHHPDPGNPEVFTLWKKGDATNIIKNNGFYGVEPDGRVRTIDLLKNRVYNDSFADGDIRVSLMRGEINNDNKYDWKFTITAVDGGIVLSKDSYGFLAPEEGYQPSHSITVSSNDVNWRSSLDRAYRFYVKSRKGDVYSNIYFKRLNAKYNDGSGSGVFEIEWLSNPNGSRNLEYDPEKDITKQYAR